MFDIACGQKYTEEFFMAKLFCSLMLFVLSFNAYSQMDYSDYDDYSFEKGLFKYRGGYIVGTMTGKMVDYDKPTHILVAGSAKKHESNQFFQSAVARGFKYMELYPDHQVVIISSPEVKDRKNAEVFRRFNVHILKEVKKVKLSGYRLVEEMRTFTHIASFDYYGHSSPWALILGKRHTTLGEGTSNLSKLRSHFMPLAAASLNGCNGGIELAPMLSKAWHIPVSGALTGSLFEGLHSDGLWYNEFVSKDAPRVRTNSVSYQHSKDCSLGTCWRMKPAASSYSGYWGVLGYGLGFYKFFCNYDEAKNCAKAAAKSLLSFPSIVNVNKGSSVEDFKQVLYDYLCPTGLGKNHFYDCIDAINTALATGDHTYTPFKGPGIPCSMRKCDAHLVCKSNRSGPKPGTCKLVLDSKRPMTTFIDEFIMLLNGFKAL